LEQRERITEENLALSRRVKEPRWSNRRRVCHLGHQRENYQTRALTASSEERSEFKQRKENQP
jgi:hypothetical protein